MSAAVPLLAYAAILGLLGPAWLCTAGWTLRAPRVALAAWAGTLAGSLVSLVLAGVLVAAPDARVTTSLADLLHACASALHEAYRAPGDTALHAAGAGLALGLPVKVLASLVASAWSGRRRRAAHLRDLRLVAGTGPVPGVAVVTHPVPAAYCLGGRRGVVVVTSSALAILEPGELAAVLAHEKAHQRGRHHLIVSVTRALASGVWILPPARRAVAAVHELLELVADDAAVRRAGRQATRAALLKLADPRQTRPVAGLAAGDTAVLLRLQRLHLARRPVHPGWRVASVVAAAGIAAVPFLVAAAPALAALRWDYCPLA